MNTEDSVSEEEEKKSDDEVLLPQVANYYKKYSQDRKLPSYFRGSTINRIEECMEKEQVSLEEQCRIDSPASSVASKSKLEWDNGADIGYENVESGEKSSQQEQGSDSTGSNNKIVRQTIAEPLKLIATTDTESDVEKPVAFKKRIGFPMAESTPINKEESLEYMETPVLRKKCLGAGDAKIISKRSSSCDDLSSSRSEKTLKKWNSQQNLKIESVAVKKIIHLRRTKPTVIECVSKKVKKDRDTQTSLTRNATAAVQTENKEEVGQQQQQRVGVVYSQHSDVENSENKTESTQTDSEMCVSKCNSFEYMFGENYEKPVLKRTEAKTNLAESGQGDGGGGSTTDSSVEILTRKFSRNLINDIDQTINLIQKLANSKRYDEITKRFYLKKIVEKIVNNYYSDDSNSEKKKERYLQENIPWKPMKKSELKTQVFVDEFVPETKKKSPFTLPKNLHSSSGDVPTDSSTTDDWRSQKTLSEKILEEQKKSSSSSDNLVGYVKKERENQLTWINNEIVHLNKLKKLLEDKTSRSNHLKNMILKPHIEDLPKRKQSTTVYMITTEKSEDSDSVTSSKTCTCSHKSNSSVKSPTCTKKTNPIDLKNARLVSNDVYTTKTANGHTTTSVSRYCFEIPLDTKNLLINSFNNIPINGKAPCKCCTLKTGTKTTVNNVEKKTTTDRALKTDDIFRVASTAQTQQQQQQQQEFCPSCGCSLSKQTVQVKCSCTQTNDTKSSTACQCNRKQCKCKECASQCNDTQSKTSSLQEKSKLETTEKSTNSSLQEKSKFETTEKSTNSSSVKEESNKKTSSAMTTESSTTTSTSTSSSSSSEFRLCPCCRLNKVALPSESSVLDSKPAPNYILCYPCYQQCEQTTKPGTRPYYTYPGHVCNCYTLLKTSALNQIRKTVKDLETIEQYCQCISSKSSSKNKDYCELCNCKLKRKGIAYTLTIEGVSPKKEHSRGTRKLPEIKIKVPDLHSHKKKKDRENKDKRKVGNGDDSKSSKSRKHKNSNQLCPSMTLQEYLSMNKPGFVQSAEERRKCLLQLALMREQRCDKYKQLLALTAGTSESLINNDNNYNEKKLFTTKEMKAITAKHYKKLPEVQQKLHDNKEKQIKFANRLLADIFNKKVRECALKGKTNLSTSYSVINFM